MVKTKDTDVIKYDEYVIPNTIEGMKPLVDMISKKLASIRKAGKKL